DARPAAQVIHGGTLRAQLEGPQWPKKKLGSSNTAVYCHLEQGRRNALGGAYGLRLDESALRDHLLGMPCRG
ncbi:MAG TPA: hypothetical protein VNG12_17560, partial [Acidimicrobiales bacterium]|nr:hypothetical protein [Acidimicrobiales bacterium]